MQRNSTFVADRIMPRARALPALTGVRFLAAFYVLVFHFGASFAERHHAPRLLCDFLNHGYIGVSIFFVLSGFILTYTYAGTMTDARERALFWEARFARIYPVYLLALLMMLPWYASSEATWGYTLAVLAGVQAWFPSNWHVPMAWNTPAWTLSVEAFFYLLFPFMIKRLYLSSSWILGGLLGACFMYAIFFHSTELHPDPAWGEPITGMLPTPLMRLPEFLIGICLGIFFLRSTRSGYRKWQMGLACAALFPLFLPIGPWVSLTVVPFSIILYQLAFDEGLLAAILSTRVMLLLGGASYAIYVFQDPIRQLMKTIFLHIDQSSSMDALVSPLVLIGFSILVFRHYEEPLRRRLRTFFGRRTRIASELPLKATAQ
jgi:peptidoglycan/LPS O-acetylase OafA/YrhL